MKIQERDFDLSPDEIKGLDIIPENRRRHVEKAKAVRFVVYLDEGEYFINAEGEPEMTIETQKEYDAFVFGTSGLFHDRGFEIVDEGYGEGEDELEFHLTALAADEPGTAVTTPVIEMRIAVRSGDNAQEEDERPAAYSSRN